MLNLRPYESYTRYWEPMDRTKRRRRADPAYYRPVTDEEDPTAA